MTRNSIVTVTRIILILSFAACGNGTQCYGCQGSAPSVTCRDEPWNATTSVIITCPAKCAIERRDISETFHFIGRHCHNNKTEDGCTYNGGMRTCKTSCSGDFCNGGSGIPEGADTTKKPGTTTTSTKATQNPGTFICWSCSMSGAGGDMACFNDPRRVTTANTAVCKPSMQCFQKVVYSRAEKRIRSFARGCQAFVEPRNKCVTDVHHTTCQTYCGQQYCNTGNGVPEGTTPPWGSAGSAGRCTPSLFFISIVLLLCT